MQFEKVIVLSLLFAIAVGGLMNLGGLSLSPEIQVETGLKCPSGYSPTTIEGIECHDNRGSCLEKAKKDVLEASKECLKGTASEMVCKTNLFDIRCPGGENKMCKCTIKCCTKNWIANN